MQRIESLSWNEPYPAGQLVRINSAGDILAVNSTYRTVYNLSNGSTAWNSNLTTSSNITEIYYSPSGTTAFVGTESTGLYYCANTANYTWTQILVETKVFSIAVLPDNTILAGTTDGLYRSVNEGVSWSITYDYPLKMFVTPSGVIYIEEYNKGLCKSADNGATWEEINFNLSKDLVIKDIQVAVNGTVFVLVDNDGVYRLDGSTWTANGFQASVVNSLHAAKDGYMYCSRVNKIYKKTTAQSYWTAVKSTDGNITSFSSKTGKIIAGHTEVMEIFQSTDSGVNWTVIGTPIYPSITAVFNEGSNVYSGTSSGLYVSADSGITWTEKLNDYTINSITADTSGNILTATSGGLYSSADHGVTWNIVSSCPVSQPYGIYYSASRYFVGGYNNLYRTTDLSTWYTSNPSGFSYPYDMVRTAAGRLYVSCPTYGIHYTDNQSTWTYTGYDNSLAIEICADGDIFAGHHNAGAGGGPWLKVLRSGQTEWVDCLDPVGEIYDIHVSTDNLLLASSLGMIYYSLNDGTNWSGVTSGLPSGIAIDAVSRDSLGFVYAGAASSRGLYKSTASLQTK